MANTHRTIWLRIGAIVALIGVIAVYSFWHTGKSWQYAEVEPGVLYTTAIQSSEQGVNACQESGCRSMIMLMSHDAMGRSPAADVVKFGFHSKVKVSPIEVDEGQFPSQEQFASVLSTIAEDKRRPALLMSMDGQLSGQAAAVYRLAVLKMPLEEVQKLAALPDAPPETTRSIQAFAARYAKELAAANPNNNGKLVLPKLTAAPRPEEPGLKPSATAPSLQWSGPDGR